jgi:hypothetical protein
MGDVAGSAGPAGRTDRGEGGTAHLVKRFFGSLKPGGPAPRDVAWVEGALREHELRLWERMYGPDRRHSVQVARDVERRLGHEATAPVLAAALLHDVGKLDAGLRTFGRVVATLTIKAAGYDEVVSWQRSRGIHRRIALYARHPELGAQMLTLAGSDPLTVAWTREHHQPRETWTVDPRLADVLDACDND